MILNEKYLRDEKRKLNNIKSFSMILENQKYNNNQKYDVFISHSFMDKELIEILYLKFEELGYKVYIDWKEEALQERDKVSEETANILKNRMNNCSGLLYVATSNINNSKWCPWELGYVDGKKNRAAIFPILKNESTVYKGQEYLGIYPYIDYCTNSKGKYDFYVNDGKNNKIYNTLKKWLECGELIIY